MKRTFTFLYSFFLLYSQANAVITAKDCNKHVDHVMVIIKDKANLNNEQDSLINNTILKSCIKNIIEADDNLSKNDDWFTEKILSDDTSKKEGNKRLKKLK